MNQVDTKHSRAKSPPGGASTARPIASSRLSQREPPRAGTLSIEESGDNPLLTEEYTLVDDETTDETEAGATISGGTYEGKHSKERVYLPLPPFGRSVPRTILLSQLEDFDAAPQSALHRLYASDIFALTEDGGDLFRLSKRYTTRVEGDGIAWTEVMRDMTGDERSIALLEPELYWDKRTESS